MERRELQLALVTELADGAVKIDFTNPLSVMSIKYTNEAAGGWAGDSAVLLTKGEGHLLHIATVWDNEEEAIEFERTMALVIENTLASRIALLAGEGGVHGLGRCGPVIHHAVEAKAHPHGLVEGFDVNVRGTLLQGVEEDLLPGLGLVEAALLQGFLELGLPRPWYELSSLCGQVPPA